MSDPVTNYRPRRLRMVRGGLLFGLSGLTFVLAGIGAIHKSPAGVDTHAVWLLVLGCVSLGSAGLILLGALRGLPRLAVTPGGVRLETLFGPFAASWESLSLFDAAPLSWGRRPRQTAVASVIGPQVSHRLRKKKQFVIPDAFQTPIAGIIAELNARRMAVDASAPLPLHRGARDFGIADFTRPWLTLSLLGTLIAVFLAELALPVGPAIGPLQPSLATLIAFGGLNRNIILASGEWYRLIIAPFLHGNLTHILSNGIALLLAGWVLERLVGRTWFLALFVVGALGGSLMSLAVNPGSLTSVGASGAIMAMFAAILVLSFRLPPGPLRTRAQVRSIRILVPSLLPLATTAAGAMQIDYGAHFGGILTGAGAGLILLRTWPDSSRLPRFAAIARTIAVVGALLVGAGGVAVAVRYVDYAQLSMMIPADQLPRTPNEMRQRGDTLAARYPDDPRAHMFAGFAALVAHDYHRSEQEMQTALQQSPRFRRVLDGQFENNASVMLAAAFQADGQRQQAKDAARIACQALPAGRLQPPMATLLSQRHLCE